MLGLLQTRRPRRDLSDVPKVPRIEVPPGPRNVVFEGPGIQVIYDNSEASASGGLVQIQESYPLPAFADQAAVFLNGWSLEYLDGDHHVFLVLARFENSRIENGTLTWEGTGTLAEQSFDESFRWRYYYTIVAWDSSIFLCGADHNDILGGGFNRNGCPLVSTVTQRQRAVVAPRSSVVLPRGFEIWYAETDCVLWIYCKYDHHVQQVAYSMGPSENAVSLSESDVDLRVGSGIAWDEHAIMHDNGYHDVGLVTHSSTLSGPGARVIQPPFTIVPLGSVNIGSPSTGEITRDVVIEGIPFDYAIPMLSGWNLSYDFGDEHVEKVGVWLSDIEYDPPQPSGSGGVPELSGGTLRYKITSVLKDDGSPSYFVDHNVHILGFSGGQVKVPS